MSTARLDALRLKLLDVLNIAREVALRDVNGLTQICRAWRPLSLSAPLRALAHEPTLLQPGVKAPGTAKITPFLPLNRSRSFTSTPSVQKGKTDGARYFGRAGRAATIIRLATTPLTFFVSIVGFVMRHALEREWAWRENQLAMSTGVRVRAPFP